jgi:hypothetical protein
MKDNLGMMSKTNEVCEIIQPYPHESMLSKTNDTERAVCEAISILQPDHHEPIHSP